MNNLKKVLALGLALVMLLGMFTIASAAKTEKMVASDLTDWASVQHKDAVALMVDLGIINGKDDGSFDPTANITRAEWAKMTYYAATGTDDAEAYLGTTTDLTDIKGHWAESYISYLASGKFVSGDGTGHFNPDNNVTVAEACKMMLTTLGYDAEDKGYQNNQAWAGNIMTDAKRNGLMNNVDRSQTALVALTRENAAEIVYNTLQANTVEAVPQWDGGNKYITTYNKLSPLGYDVFGIIRVEGKVDKINTNGYADFSAVTFPEGIGVTAANLKEIKASADIVGETVSVFVEVTNAKYDEKSGELLNPGAVVFRKVCSSSVARGASTADVTYTAGFNWANVDNVNKDEYVAEFAVDNNNNITTKFYFNGTSLSKAEFESAKGIGVNGSKVWDTANAKPIPGLVVEFFLNDEGNIDVVKAYEHTVAQLTSDVETRTTSAGELQVKVPGVFATWTPADKVSGYQGLVEDDVVLYYKTVVGASTTYVMEKAEKVTGKVTSSNSSNQITVNGTRYKRTGLTTVPASQTEGYGLTGTKTFANWADRDNEFDFYLDKSGSVCFIEQVTDAISKDKIALVMAAEWTGTDMTTASGKLEAKLLFIDGTTQIVTVSKLNDLRVVTKHSSNASTAAKEIIGGPLEGTKLTDGEAGQAITALADTKIGKANASFYNYRVVDGKYELTQVVEDTDPLTDDGWTETTPITDAKVEKKTDFSNGASTYAADSKTTFLVAKGEAGEEEYYAYTGFKNVPEMASASGLAVGTEDNGGIAKYVYLTTINYSDDVPEGYVFIYNNDWNDDPNNEDCYLVNVVNEEGEVTQMSVTAGLRDDIYKDDVKNLSSWTTGSNNWVGKFVRIDSIDEKGVVSAMTPVADYSSLANLAAIGNEVVRDDAGNSLDYDNITKFVVIDLAVAEGPLDTICTDDTLEFASASTFDPENFFDATQVEKTPRVGTQAIVDAAKAYDSVQVAMIHADNSTTADYIYVLRVVW